MIFSFSSFGGGKIIFNLSLLKFFRALLKEAKQKLIRNNKDVQVVCTKMCTAQVISGRTCYNFHPGLAQFKFFPRKFLREECIKYFNVFIKLSEHWPRRIELAEHLNRSVGLGALNYQSIGIEALP